MKPRMHADLIKAWADGAEIQIQVRTDDDMGREWIDVTGTPVWDNSFPLRIKPREFPKSSLDYSSLCKVVSLAAEAVKGTNEGYSTMLARMAADAAVQQYILDTEAS